MIIRVVKKRPFWVVISVVYKRHTWVVISVSSTLGPPGKIGLVLI